MPANILANGTTAATAEQAIAAGTVVSLKSDNMQNGKVPAGSVVVIELKSETGAYIEVDRLVQRKPAIILSGAGTYRFTRPLNANANCGVFSG